jgi:arylsulfatase A-like enzyme
MEPHAPYHFHVGRDFGRRPIDAYDSEIAEADAQVARLLERLEKTGERDRTIVVVFGDHGEGFGEHNNREHGASLYDHQVRVPLIVHVPGLQHREITKWVTLADITPTLLTLIGQESKPPRMGRPSTPLMTDVPAKWPDWGISERAASATKVPRSWERAVWRGDNKLIWLTHDRTYQFFDL